jgi:hypothetical protein
MTQDDTLRVGKVGKWLPTLETEKISSEHSMKHDSK